MTVANLWVSPALLSIPCSGPSSGSLLLGTIVLGGALSLCCPLYRLGDPPLSSETQVCGSWRTRTLASLWSTWPDFGSVSGVVGSIVGFSDLSKS